MADISCMSPTIYLAIRSASFSFVGAFITLKPSLICFGLELGAVVSLLPTLSISTDGCFRLMWFIKILVPPTKTNFSLHHLQIVDNIPSLSFTGLEKCCQTTDRLFIALYAISEKIKQ